MGVINDVLGWVLPARNLPIPQPDGNTPIKTRGSRYGDVVVQNVFPGKQQAADEGAAFVITNPTLGTGVAYALQTAFSDTAGLFVIQNTWDPTDPQAKRTYLDYVRLILTAAPATTVSQHFAIKTDIPGSNRVPTANSRNDLPANVNGASAVASQSRIWQFAAGSLTVPASSPSARTVARAALPTSLGIVGDSYILQAGGVDHPAYSGLTAARATAPATLVANVGPVSCGPGGFIVVYNWWLTAITTAPSYEYEVAIFER